MADLKHLVTPPNKHKYLVRYNTGLHEGLYIVIWAETRADVKPILKHHIGNEQFRITKITEVDVNEKLAI